MRAKDNDDNKDILGEEIMSIFSDKAPSLDCREIILELKEQTDNKEELELI